MSLCRKGPMAGWRCSTARAGAMFVMPEVICTTHGNDFPVGKTDHYAHSSGFTDERLNHNLTSMTDAKGQLWLQVFYAPTADPTKVAFDNVDYLQRGPYRIKHRRF